MLFLQGVPYPEHVGTADGSWLVFLASLVVMAILAGLAMTIGNRGVVSKSTPQSTPADTDLRKAA